MTDDIPRRCQLEHMTPAERAIYDAMGVVEAAGCDVQLTEAVNLLQKARDRVADFVDGVEHPLVSYPKSEPEVLLQVIAEREDWRMREGRAQHEKALAQKRIKSLEDGIVVENKRTSVIEQELQAVKDVLIARDEDFHPEGLVSVAEVVARILGERDGAQGELDSIRSMLAETSDDSPNEYQNLKKPGETGAAVSALLSSNKNLANSIEAQSRALDAADERASTATDILCVALGKDHGRGGLVEHCQKAAEKIKELEKDGVLLSDTVKKLSDMLVTWATVVPCRCGCDTCRRGGHLVCSKCLSRSVLTWEDGQRLALTDALFREHQIEGDETLRDVVVRLANAAATRTRELEVARAECLAWFNAMKSVFRALGRDMSGMKTPQELAEQAVEKIREERTESRLYSDCLRQSEGEEVAVKAKLSELRADQRATGDVLAGILGRERCEDGNVCLANDVALKVEELQTACDSYHLGSCYAEEPCLECAAAKRRRASRHAKDSGGSGAAQPATPEPAGEWAEIPRPANLGSGLEPHLPDCPGHTQAVFVYVVTGMCSVCSARVRVPRPRVANGPRDPAMILTLPQTPQPKLTDLVSRERLASAFLAASNAGNWRSAFAELAHVLEE